MVYFRSSIYSTGTHKEDVCMYFRDRLVGTDSNLISLCARTQRLDLLIGYLSIPPSVQSLQYLFGTFANSFCCGYQELVEVTLLNICTIIRT
jgi:hypothetical protein